MRVFILVSLILGCFFGAGFVSGKEVSAYFSVYGDFSFVAIILSCIVLFFLLLFFLNMSDRLKNFSQFVHYYFGKFARVIDILFALCLVILIGSMLAASGEVSVGLGMPRLVLILLTILLTIRVVLGNVKSLARLNIIVVPIMLVVVCMSSIGVPISSTSINHILVCSVSGIEYAFMNIITLGIFMLEVGGRYTTKQRVVAALVSCIIICIVMIMINNAIMYYDLQNVPMPTMTLAQMRCSTLGYFANITIWFGLFTTITSLLFMLTNYMRRFVHSDTYAVLLSLGLGVMVSMFGFGNIVSYIYTVIGIFGIIIVINSIIIDKKNTRTKSCIRSLL